MSATQDAERDAMRAALAVFAPAISASATAAVRAVDARTESGYLAEAARDVAALRADPGLARSLAGLEASAAEVVHEHLSRSMQSAFRSTIEGEAPGLGLRFSWSDADAATLAGHPIVDRTAAEWAEELARRAGWRVRSVVTQAALGAIQSTAVAGRIQRGAQAWADEVARLVGDAWHAGTTAARAAMARALSG